MLHNTFPSENSCSLIPVKFFVTLLVSWCQKSRCHTHYQSFFFCFCQLSVLFHLSFSYVTAIINSSILFPHPFSSPPHSPFSTSFLAPPAPLYAAVYNLLSRVSFLISVLYFLLGGDLQTSCGTLDEGGLDDTRLDWEEERELERLACEGDDFVPPKIMVRDQHYNDLQII